MTARRLGAEFLGTAGSCSPSSARGSPRRPAQLAGALAAAAVIGWLFRVDRAVAEQVVVPRDGERAPAVDDGQARAARNRTREES